MSTTSLKKGILAVGLVMALSPATLLAADKTMAPNTSSASTEATDQPSEAEMQEEIKKLQQEQQRLESEVRQQKATKTNQYKEIQDIPDPKNLGSD